jgi:hypothetical protein
MSLILKRIVWDDGSATPDDFEVMHDGEVIGRIYRMNGAPWELWRWTHRWNTRQANGGVADTVEAAKIAFRAAWEAR